MLQCDSPWLEREDAVAEEWRSPRLILETKGAVMAVGMVIAALTTEEEPKAVRVLAGCSGGGRNDGATVCSKGRKCHIPVYGTKNNMVKYSK